jgi:hypothetical protein
MRLEPEAKGLFWEVGTQTGGTQRGTHRNCLKQSTEVPLNLHRPPRKWTDCSQ